MESAEQVFQLSARTGEVKFADPPRNCEVRWTYRAESWCRDRHVRKMGAPFNRELNRGHTLTALAAHKPQS
jgi:hypothetical protein